MTVLETGILPLDDAPMLSPALPAQLDSEWIIAQACAYVQADLQKFESKLPDECKNASDSQLGLTPLHV